MGSEPTKLPEQAILNYSTDFDTAPPLLTFGNRIWNGTSWIKGGGFSLPAYDYVSLNISSATETYTFKTGGSGGTTVATVVIVYTSSSRADISTVTRT